MRLDEPWAQNAAREALAIDLPSGIGADTVWKFESSCPVNGRVVAVPFNAHEVLVVDPTSRGTFFHRLAIRHQTGP